MTILKALCGKMIKTNMGVIAKKILHIAKLRKIHVYERDLKAVYGHDAQIKGLERCKWRKG